MQMFLMSLKLVLAPVGAVLMKMLAGLLTEKFLKSAIIQLLEHVVQKTETDEDNKLLEEAKKAWQVSE